MTVRTLTHRTNSKGIIVESQLPHLIGMDDDILSTGIVMYHLKEGKTLIGGTDAAIVQDIALTGEGIETEHCEIVNADNGVVLYPTEGSMCMVNGLEISEPVRLTQGSFSFVGKFNVNTFILVRGRYWMWVL